MNVTVGAIGRFISYAAAALAFLVVLSSCADNQASISKSPPWHEVGKRVWRLESLEGRSILAGTKITLGFGENRAFGSAGANRYFAPYARGRSNEISFSAIGATKMHRDDPPGTMKQEREYLAALGTVDRYRLENGRLVLLGRGGEMLAFSPDQKADR